MRRIMRAGLGKEMMKKRRMKKKRLMVQARLMMLTMLMPLVMTMLVITVAMTRVKVEAMPRKIAVM